MILINYLSQVFIQKYIFAIFCLLVLSNLLRAQDPLDIYEAKIYNEDKNFFFTDVTDVIASSDGYIYVGTMDLGLIRINDNSHKIFQTGDLSNRHHDRVISLYEDDTNTIWVGDEVGFQCFDRDKQTFTSKAKSYFKDAHPYSKGIHAICKTSEGNLLLGSKASFMEYDIEQDSIIGLYLNKDLSFDHNSTQNHIFDIIQDFNDPFMFWVVGRSGLYNFNSQTKSVDHVIKREAGNGFKKVLAFDHSIVLLSENRNDISTFNTNTSQLKVVHNEVHKFFIDQELQGSYQTIYWDVKKVNEQYILINSRASGPALFDVTTLKLRQLYIEHPILTEIDKYEDENGIIDKYLKDCIWAVIDKSGRLSASHIRENYFRTIDPVISNLSNNSKSATKLGIEEFYIDNSIVHPNGICENDTTYNLKYYQRDIGFKFNERNPAPISELKYEYNLNNSDWKPALEDDIAIFTSLSGGEHKIGYRSRINDEIVNEKSVLVSIEKLWYEKWIYRILLLGSILILAYLITRYRRKQQKERDRLLAQMASLEMSVLRTQMNPHFLFNSINSINQYIITEDPAKASDYLTKFSRLMRSILNNSKSQMISLEDEIKSIVLYIDLEKLRHEDMFDYDISIDPDISTSKLKVPPLLLQPYIENAIRHGIAPLKNRKKGQLLVNMSRLGSKIEITIVDNGVGVKKSQKLNQKKVVKRESHGMSITNDRINLINRVYGGGASVKLTDDQPNNLENPGTRVTIVLPEILEYEV